MAAPLESAIFRPRSITFLTIFVLSLLSCPWSHAEIFTFTSDEILQVVSSSCFVALPENVNCTEAASLLSTLASVSFRQEYRVVLGRVETSSFRWPNGNVLATDETAGISSNFNDPPVLLLFKRIVKDRKCLLLPKISPLPDVLSYGFRSQSDYEIENVVEFINDNCETFRLKDGGLSHRGIHRNEILRNVFSPHKHSCTKNNGDIRDQTHLLTCENPGKIFIQRYRNKTEQYCKEKQKLPLDCLSHTATTTTTTESLQPSTFCERIPMPSTEEFLHNYVFKSKPVIIQGATQQWPALTKWTNKYLREMYGEQIVHIKVTPSGEYEGVERGDLWENELKIKIPQEVLAKLPYPDLVVVRPATMEIKFAEFLHIVEKVAIKEITNMSAYLEYSSITAYFPELREDFSEMSFFKNVLGLRHINMWLSDGNTLGKLHFDPFDNFMCQISGEKEFILYDPHHNERLYESHIQEAILSYNKTSKRFSRQRLLDSTSMVMSPVDISRPNLQRFPKFADAVPMSCKIKPGDVLYTPSFWWHEVKSSPNITERRNLAINFWYEPFLEKEFPCPECGLDVNPRYFHLL